LQRNLENSCTGAEETAVLAKRCREKKRTAIKKYSLSDREGIVDNGSQNRVRIPESLIFWKTGA
jgi:hypothetical protein